MEPINRIRKHLILILIALVSIGSASLVRAQGVEQEPNNACTAPQDLGALALPFTLNGSLDATPEAGDVDFYRFTATPGTLIQVDLEGAPTGQGTLGDPFLGFFDAQCILQSVNDDNGFTLNSRLQISVPTDGVVVLAATSCCDQDFVGNPGVSGSYRISITVPALIGSINGTIVDAVNNSPLPGDFPTFTFVELRSCTEFGCFSINSQSTDQEGRFHFETDFQGQRLVVGTYQVFATAGGYNPAETEPFEVSEGEHKDIGTLGLQPLPRIGSISGRVVDALTGAALPGDQPPFAFVDLMRCFETSCFEFVNSQPTDAEGRFRFESDLNGLPLPPGSYQLIAHAEEYQDGSSGPFDAGEGEHKDVGDLGLQPFPVRFSEVHPCGDLPPEGGLCHYSVRVANNLPTQFVGLAWSPVASFRIGSITNYTLFDAHRPRDMTLDAQESQMAHFAFYVPGTVRDGAIICTQVFAGQGNEVDGAFFNTAGHKNLFCIAKGFTGGFSVLPDAEANRIFRELESGIRITAPRIRQQQAQ